MAIPDFQSLLLPVLAELGSGAPTRTADLIARASDRFELSPDERAALLPSGRQPIIANRVHWSLAYLNRAGLVERLRRGEYRITDAGTTLLAAAPDKLSVSYLMTNFPDLRAFVRGGNGAEQPGAVAGKDAQSAAALPAGTPEERLLAAAEEMRVALAADLLERLRLIPPDAFERLIVDLLIGMGFGGSRADAGARLGRSGDGGVDGVIREDALGLDVVYLQAKRYGADNPVGPDAIRGFVGALLAHGATKGVFVTTSRFTPAAREAGTHYRGQRLVLLDGEELARLMMEHGVGVRTTQVIRLQRVDLGDYEDGE